MGSHGFWGQGILYSIDHNGFLKPKHHCFLLTEEWNTTKMHNSQSENASV